MVGTTEKYVRSKYLESKGMRAIFQKKGKKGQNIWKFGQKYTKFQSLLKKGRWLRAIITRNKLLEKSHLVEIFHFVEIQSPFCLYLQNGLEILNLILQL